MAELAPRERLQPSLLDRLTDFEPMEAVEPRERRVLSMRALREGVLRDLAWLLNTTSLLSVADLPAYPHVADSVVNFGVPGLAGKTVTSLQLRLLEKSLRQAIWDFEPRLLRPTVVVRAMPAGATQHRPHADYFSSGPGGSGPGGGHGVRGMTASPARGAMGSTASGRSGAQGEIPHNRILIEIEADMWAQPCPERLYLKTELDLDTATMRLAPAFVRAELPAPAFPSASAPSPDHLLPQAVYARPDTAS